MKHLLAILSFCLCQTLYAESGGWVTTDGKPVSNSDSIKSMDGFGGQLVVTPDLDWERKWNTSPETVPHFRQASEVEYGQRLVVLTFFINPKPDKSGKINITCDIKVTRPGGSISANPKNISCASGQLQGNPHNVRLSAAVINYVAEKSDPTGVWEVEVTISDRNRGVAIPLRTQFRLKANTAINSDA